MNNILQYVRNRKRQKTGMVVAIPFSDKIHIGWSLCKRGDKFSREMGYSIANGRATTNPPYVIRNSVAKYGKNLFAWTRIPSSVKKTVEKVMVRCEKQQAHCTVARMEGAEISQKSV